MLEQVSRHYGALHQHSIAVDFVQPHAELSGYKVVLVPNLYMVGQGVAENLDRFVSDGGRLVMSFFSGMVDSSDHILLGGYPAPFRRLLGIRVEEFDPYAPGQTNEIVTAEGARVPCDTWSDVIDLEGAESIATFAHDFYAGRPAITQHAYGSGRAYYLGTNPSESYLASLLTQICGEAGVRAPIDVPAGVEAVCRTSGSDNFLFLLNHQADSATVHVEFEAEDMLTGAHHADSVTLSPYGVAILRQPDREG